MRLILEDTICDKIDRAVAQAVSVKRNVLQVVLTRAERHQLYMHAGDRFVKANRTQTNYYGNNYRGIYRSGTVNVHIFAEQE